MGKWDDDIPLQPRGSVQPSTVSGLLRMMQLTDAPTKKQEAAIRDWLRVHKPSSLMEHSLRRKGFARLLDKRASA
jgi:hypothetical protein